jgi:hypothetical protein
MNKDVQVVLVLFPDAGSSGSRWRLDGQARPLSALGPALPGQLLLHVQGRLVVHSQDGNTRGWSLQRNADIGGDGVASINFAPLIADGLILMYNSSTGDMLAYEHDPDGGEGKP